MTDMSLRIKNIKVPEEDVDLAPQHKFKTYAPIVSFYAARPDRFTDETVRNDCCEEIGRKTHPPVLRLRPALLYFVTNDVSVRPPFGHIMLVHFLAVVVCLLAVVRFSDRCKIAPVVCCRVYC